jgi:hypothetical protein
MNQYHIRFNKSRGQPGRGTPDHAWRVFENGREFLFKHFKIDGVPVYDLVTDNGGGGDDWNMACEGYMTVDYATSTAVISSQKLETIGQPTST